jgi:hypothetical protein
MPNLANAPTYQIADRKALRDRIFWALLSSEEIQRYPRGTPLNQVNWDARQIVINAFAGVPIPGTPKGEEVTT